MGNIVFSQAAKFLQKRRNTRRWIAVVLCLALVVTSGTFGVLTRHGSALTGAEQILDCAYEGHVHGEECYNEAGELICGYADYCVHEHNESCYDGEDNLVCQLPEIPAHVHDESCYVEEKQLICEMEENEIHQHTDDCYDIELGDIVCGMEEHVHDDSCYELITEGEEIPENGEAAQGGESAGSEEPTQSEEPAGSEAPVQNEESAGNADAAQSEEPAGNEESTQSTEPAGNEESVQSTEPAESAVPQSETPSEDTEATQSEEPAESVEASQSEAPAESTEPAGDGINECAENRRLICEKEEHTHGNECYNQNKVLKCGKEEGIHTHNEKCYEMKQVAKCGKLELHTHSEECYTDGVLTCGKLELTEHVHGEECFKKAPVMELSTVVDGVTVTVTAAEEDIIPEGAQVSVTPVVKTDAEALEDETAKAEAEALNEKYDEIQQGLEASMEEDETKELKHFQAYDINFYVENENNEKEEVQLGGDVTVKMEFDGSTLPEEITSDETVQIDSVDLVDIKETEEGLKPETVQDAVVDTTQDDSVQKAEMTMSGEGSTIAFAWIGEINPETGEYLYEDEDVIIRVTPMAEGILPENAKLQVIPLTASEETGEQYQQVAEKLMEKAEKEEYAIAGFLAYDISFVDEDGNKIEPNGEVKVTMNYKEAKIPAEVNAATYDFANEGEAAESTGTEAELNVKVMHLEESEEGSVQVVDMAEQNKVTALETTEEQKIQNAEFVTGGFSVFTITWTWDPSSPYVYDDDEVRITITAVDVDAIPEETTLSITPIKADNPKTAEQYQEVARKLIEKAVEEEYDIAGFLAYDISLKDKDGVEIEPNGKVKVTMEYKRPVAIVEIDADTYALVSLESEDSQGDVLSKSEESEAISEIDVVSGNMNVPAEDAAQEMETSVTVMHLVEDEAGEVAQVVDMGENGDIAALETTENLEIQKAEFETDSFSTFVIAWKNDYGTTYFNINVHHVNADGKDVAHEGTSISGSGVHDFSDYNDLSGLTLQEVRLDSTQGDVITSYEITTTKGQRYEYYTLTFKNGDEPVRTYERTNYSWYAESADVYLIYQSSQTTPPATGKSEPTISKEVWKNTDGTYNLDLTVSGIVGSEDKKAAIDILFIVDRSGSMGYCAEHGKSFSGDDKCKTCDKSATRLKAVQNAIAGENGLIATLSNSENSKKIDAHYAIVEFSGSGAYENDSSDKLGPAKASKNILEWTDSASEARRVMNNITASGGTNYQSGIKEGKTVLTQGRQDVEKVVIFLTDGEPTFSLKEPTANELEKGESWLEKKGYTKYSDGKWYDEQGVGSRDALSVEYDWWGNISKIEGEGINQTLAETEIETLNCSRFYGIGFGDNIASNIEKLKTSVNAKIKATYSATNTEGINNAFSDIIAETMYFMCDNVVISDALSENVKLAVGDNTVIDGSILKVTVVDKDGNPKGTQKDDGSVDLPATDQNKAITLKAIFDESTQTIKLDFGTDADGKSYKLEKDLTYKITAKIEATDKAYENYRSNGYNNQGEANTGTYSGQDGLYTNKVGEAKVSYKYKDNPDTLDYDKPVIQLQLGTIVVEKKVEGLEGEDAEEALNQLKNQLEFKVKSATNDAIEIGSKKLGANDFTYNESTGTYVWSFSGLKPGTQYKVSEINSELEGKEYRLSEESDISEKNVTALTVNEIKNSGTGYKASFTNKYVPDTQSLAVVKIWEDEGDAFGKRPESIDIRLEYKPKESSEGWAIYTTEANPDGIYTIRGNECVDEVDDSRWNYTLDNLPTKVDDVEVEYRISEYLVPESYTNQEEVTDTATTITNTYNSPFDWQMIKQSSSTDSEGKHPTLEGAEFQLKESQNIVAIGTSNAQGVISWAAAVDVSLENLTGTFIMTETKAPIGYRVSDKSWQVIFKNGILVSVDGSEGEVDENKTIRTFYFNNEVLYALPSAGGEGIYWYSIGGTLLMMIGALILYRNKNKKVRGCRRA